MQLTLPTALTWIRILLLPVVIVVFYLPYEWSRPLCAAIFALGGITDWLDGYLARKLNQQSKFGAFLDPVADKLLVAGVLVLLVESEPTPVVALPAIVIIGREIVISALREWMAELGKRRLVAVSMLGKIKTTAQITALLFMLYYEPILQVSTFKVGLWLLYIAAALTIYSMVVYLKAALAAARIEG